MRQGEEGKDRMTDSLSTQGEFLGSVVKALPNLVVVIDKLNTVIFANAAICNILHMKTNEVEGQRVENLPLLRNISADVRAAQAKQLNGSSNRSIDVRCMVDQNQKIFRVIVQEMDGGARLIMNDITNESENLERLYTIDRLVSIGEMASGTAHEINNPLTSIIGLSELLLNKVTTEDAIEDVKGIHSEAKRAALILKNLLIFSRGHAPSKELVQINQVIQDVLKLRKHEHELNHIEVETRFDDDLPQITIDSHQMQQVFLNVILNSEWAMLEAHNKGKLIITTSKVNDDIRVTLADDGFGIASEILPRVFDPFFTIKEIGKGTGLGLSVCFGIVRSHGGKIYGESEAGHGAVFTIELPLDKTAQSTNMKSRRWRQPELIEPDSPKG
jgi:signal transduction histidine kinase